MEEKAMAQDTVIKVGGIDIKIIPFAFQYYAKDFYEAYKKIKIGPKFSPARLFLLMKSIELAAKSLHLGQSQAAADLRRIGHDLKAACDQSVLAQFGISLSANEETELKKANVYYESKGFEYFLFETPGVPLDRSGPQMALLGWPDLPDEGTLEVLLTKLLSPKL